MQCQAPRTPHSCGAGPGLHRSVRVGHRPNVITAASRSRLHAASADLHLPQQQQQQSLGAEEASTCPFLAALPRAPSADVPWHQRLQQAFNPPQFQRALFSHSNGSNVLHVPSQLLFPDAHMVGTGDLGKQVLAGEADGSIGVAFDILKRASTLFGKNAMLTVPEPRHSFLRNLMQPAFTPEAVGRYLPRVEVVVGRWLSSWAAAGDSVPGHQQFSAMTFDFILQAVFGRDYSREEVLRLSQVFKTFTMGFLAWPFLDLPFTRYGNALKARQQLVDEFMVAVNEERAHQAAGGEPRGVVGLLLQAEDEQGFKLSDAELQDNLLLLLLAGHDTSSSTLALMMVNLQQHPEVVRKLRQEQQQLVAKHGPRFTAAVMREMVYADAVVRETLRKDNIVSATARKTLRDIDLGGYQVPAGSLVQVPLTYLSEQDPRWAGQEGGLHPAAFNPDRLLGKEGSKPGWMMPFGHGPRYCIGGNLAMAEMKCFLALLARSYDFQVDGNTEWLFAIGRVPKNGLPMTITHGVPAAAIDQPVTAGAAVV